MLHRDFICPEHRSAVVPVAASAANVTAGAKRGVGEIRKSVSVTFQPDELQCLFFFSAGQVASDSFDGEATGVMLTSYQHGAVYFFASCADSVGNPHAGGLLNPDATFHSVYPPGGDDSDAPTCR